MFEDRPPAKVNLTLAVVGRRPDGFHELRSIFLRIGLTDRLMMAPTPTGDRDQLTVTGLSGAPSTRDNLVLRALDALRAHAGINFPPLAVTLDKRIPAAAGLGGGSSDGASALRLAQAVWGIRVARNAELDLAASLGSDIPFFYFNMPAASVAGRGEDVSWLPAINGGLGLLLVHPPFKLATTQVFARHDKLGVEHGDTIEAIGEILAIFDDEPTANEVLEAAGGLRDANDLWPSAASLAPSLPALRDELEAQTSRPWQMSGSGPTLFALYPSAAEAADAGKGLVAGRSPALENALINAVDVDGPDPAWRFP